MTVLQLLLILEPICVSWLYFLSLINFWFFLQLTSTYFFHLLLFLYLCICLFFSKCLDWSLKYLPIILPSNYIQFQTPLQFLWYHSYKPPFFCSSMDQLIAMHDAWMLFWNSWSLLFCAEFSVFLILYIPVFLVYCPHFGEAHTPVTF